MRTTRNILSCMLLVFGLQSFAFAERDLHIYLLGDKDDPDIGKDVDKDIQNMYSTIHMLLGRAAYGDHVHWAGKNVNFGSSKGFLSGIESDLRRNNCSSEDAVFIYVAGHGETRTNRKHGFLTNRRRDFVARTEIISMVKRYNPGLIVLVSDSCAKRTGKRDPVAAAPARNEPICPLLQRLFFEAHGIVDFNACKPGQSAWPSTTELSDGTRVLGGLFTHAFTETLFANEKRSIGWKTVFSLTSSLTAKKFKKNYPGGADDEFTGEWQQAQVPHSYAMNVAYQRVVGRPTDNVGMNNGGNGNVNNGNNSSNRVPLGLSLRTCKDGVHIVSVKSGSPATRVIDVNSGNRMQLEAGDHIVSVNGIAVNNHSDTVRLVNNTPRYLRLQVRDRNSNKIFVFKTELR